MLIWARDSIWKDADRVGPLDHLVDRGIFGGDGGQRQRLAGVFLEQIQAASDRREHPECQAIDLEDAQRIQVVLVPLTTVRPGMLAFSMGTISQRGSRVRTMPPTCWER